VRHVILTRDYGQRVVRLAPGSRQRVTENGVLLRTSLQQPRPEQRNLDVQARAGAGDQQAVRRSRVSRSRSSPPRCSR